MEHNGLPDKTEFVSIGNSIYLRIPPNHHEHHNIEHLKQEDGPKRKDAKILKEKNSDQENYGSFWNPDHPTQQDGDKQ